MYKKANFYGDENLIKAVLTAKTAAQTKILMNGARGFDNGSWKKLRVEVMKKACLEKFKQNRPLRIALLGTNNSTLVEASPSDIFWGIGLNFTNALKLHPNKWRGSNMLGRILSEVRETLAHEFPLDLIKAKKFYYRNFA